MKLLKELIKEEERIRNLGMQIGKRLEELEKEKANLLREFYRLEGEMNQIRKMKLGLEEESEEKEIEAPEVDSKSDE